MTPLLSGTHTLNDQKAPFSSPQINQPRKNNTSTWKRAAKTSHGSRRQLPQEECRPPRLADEILVRCETEEVEGKGEKKSQSNYCDPEEIWRLSRWCVWGRLNGTVAEKGKMNYRF